jgi:hypothetical protein
MRLFGLASKIGLNHNVLSGVASDRALVERRGEEELR